MHALRYLLLQAGKLLLGTAQLPSSCLLQRLRPTACFSLASASSAASFSSELGGSPAGHLSSWKVCSIGRCYACILLQSQDRIYIYIYGSLAGEKACCWCCDSPRPRQPSMASRRALLALSSVSSCAPLAAASWRISRSFATLSASAEAVSLSCSGDPTMSTNSCRDRHVLPYCFT